MRRPPPQVVLFTKLTLAALLFALALWLTYTLRDNAVTLALVEQFGYLGMFLVAFVSGFNLLVPLPAISFLLLFESAGFSVVSIVAVISVGMTLGDGLGYLLGRLGRASVSEREAPQWLRALERSVNQHRFGLPILLYCYAAVVPLPNELLVIPAALSRQPWWLVLTPVFFGNVTMNVLVAFGLVSIFL